jgi:hypothetical protein
VPITWVRVLIVSVLIVVTLVGMYLLIPRVAGLKQTWGQLRRGGLPVATARICTFGVRPYGVGGRLHGLPAGLSGRTLPAGDLSGRRVAPADPKTS